MARVQKQEQEPQAPAMSVEQAADLAALQESAGGGFVAQQEQQQEQQAQQAEQGEREKLAAEITGLVLAFVGIAKPILPSLQEIYTPETTSAAANAVASVCMKHGWLPGGLLGDWGEEIAAAVVLVPLGMATAQGVKADIAAKRRPEPDRVAASLAVSPATVAGRGQEGAKTVTVGAVIPSGEGAPA